MTTIKLLTAKLTKLLASVVLLGMITGTAYAGPILGSLEYNGVFFPEDGSGGTASLGTATFLDFVPVSTVEISSGDIATILGGGVTVGHLGLSDFSISPFIGTTGSPVTVWNQIAGGNDLSFALTSLVITTQSTGTPNILALSGRGIFSATGYDDTAAVWSLTASDASGGSAPVLTFAASTSVSEPSMLALLGLTLMGLGWSRRRKLSKVA